jgi:radical SAM superfamily enzyme YgiQ (UPF0313 family)
LSYLESKGIRADFLDRQVERSKKVNYADYDIVGFSVSVNNVKNSLKSATDVKKMNPTAQVVFGGPFATAYPEALIKNEHVDAVVVGEGEETFFEYVGGAEKSRIQGLYSKENGSIQFAGARAWNQDLNSLPFPAIHRLDLTRYNVLSAQRSPTSSIITSRGCPYQCAFCFHNMGHEWRERSPENVVDEIEWQVNKLGVREISIADDNFSFNRARAAKIFDEILKRNIKVSFNFGVGVRADRLDRELLGKAYAAGVWLLTIAPETGSAKTLKKLNKQFKLEDFKKILRTAKEIGMATDIFLMVGFPWETDEDTRATLKLAEDLDPDCLSIHHFISFPSTGLSSGNQEIDLGKIGDNSYEADLHSHDKKLHRTLASFRGRYYLSRFKHFRKSRRLDLLMKIVQPQTLKYLSKICLEKFQHQPQE